MNFTHTSRSQFANWLDAFVSGKSTPGQRVASHSEATEMQATARQIHDLAGQATRTPIDPTFPDSWEIFMQAKLSNTSISPTLSALPSVPIPKLHFGRDGSWARVDRVTGILLAATLLIALSAGIWRATDWNNSPPPSPTNELSALIQGTPDAQGSPSAMAPVDLPTAEDCTVEPLTVDEVVSYVKDPIPAMYNLDVVSSGTPHPLATLDPGPAPDWIIAEAASIQRMWMACVKAESLFQIWALEAPDRVVEQVVLALPPLTGEDDARAILELLQTSGGPVEWNGQKLFRSNYPGYVKLVDQSPDNSMVAGDKLVLGFQVFGLDGTIKSTSNIYAGPSLPDDPSLFNLIEDGGSCNLFLFQWVEAKSKWMISSDPHCAG